MRISIRATTNWASTPRIKRAPPPVMTNAEFRKLCTKLKINDNDTASVLLGPSWRTCQRYWYGDLPVPPPLARLLRAAALHSLTHADLKKLATPVP